MKSLFIILSLIFCPIAIADTPPPPAEAVFQLETKHLDPNTFTLRWHIKPGFFLYQQSIRLIEPEKEDRFAEITPLHLPKANIKRDSKGRTFAIYRHKLVLPVHVLGLHPGDTTIHVSYQGCADDGYCYPPKTLGLQLTFDTERSLTQVTLEPVLLSTPPDKSLSHLLKNPFKAQFIITLLIFYLLGLLLSFTPCVLPMIPVLSSIIVGRGKALSTRHAFGLSLTYVLSMSLTYALVGATLTLIGKNLQTTLQTPLAIGLLSVFFVLLALSMFNVFELKLPTALQSKLAQFSYRQSHGHYINALVMGGLSTLILSPCVTAPLIGALSYIAETGKLWLGISALFMLGLGMGTPLLLIGTSLGRVLPRQGAWMNQVKGLFGLVLIAVAIDLVSRIISPIIIMLLWSVFFIFSGLYLGAFKSAKTNLSKLRQGLALIVLAYGFLILIGASQGHTSPWKPLSMSTHRQLFSTVRSLEELNPLLAQARIEHQAVLIDFYADWCRSCKIIDDMLQTDKNIEATGSSFKLIRADITEDNEETRALSAYYHVIAPPTFIFISKTGEELEALRHAGEIDISALNTLLERTLEE